MLNDQDTRDAATSARYTVATKHLGSPGDEMKPDSACQSLCKNTASIPDLNKFHQPPSEGADLLVLMPVT